MQALQCHSRNRLTGMMESAAASTPIAASRPALHAVQRRIDSLLRAKGDSRARTSRRERDFWRAIDDARLAVAQGDLDQLAASILALDLLSLELCDD